MDVGDVLARYKPTERTLDPILLDGSIQSEIDEATRRLRQARRNEAGLRSDVPAIEEEIEKLEQRADEASAVFTVAAIAGERFDQLKYENPPTEEDWGRYKGTIESNRAVALMGHIGAPEFNFEAFIPKLIGLSIVKVDGEEVDWSESDGVKLWATLHDGARSVLADGVWGVNANRSTRPLSETATGMTSNSGSGSTTSVTEESPIQSSSDES